MPRYLFVCSGNICRSPMAEHFARSLLPDGDFSSAGTMAGDGMGPSMGAVAVMAEVGVDITAHRSRDLWSLDLSDTLIYALHAEHLASIRNFRPDAQAVLLDPEGRSIADPYGSDLGAFRRARDEIHAAVQARSVEWQRPQSASGSAPRP